ncbi:aromatic ring-hydroxylating dioxygenase subunit alpha [Nocardioides sp. KR10-350]|uniref:aromatic ring-hydroxylating oxygenase subunit alpha n=1 Tax=Nocardioides cheoyonin TaxID=3156615 RepID=UPI0032B34314
MTIQEARRPDTRPRTKAQPSATALAIAQQIRRQAKARSLDEATTLPAGAYTDPGFYELEVERIFRRDWIPVARLEQVPTPGDFLTLDLPGEPIVVVRGQDDQVRVFSRVCRHRFADILSDVYGNVPVSGCVKYFECPYHLWSYDLDGALIRAVDFERRQMNGKFDPSRFGLHEIRTEIWQGYVFINFDENTTRPLDMDALARVTGNMDGSKYRIVRSMVWADGAEIDSGWKAMLENYLEFYHHIGAHQATLEKGTPGLNTTVADGSDGNNVYWATGHHSAETAAEEIDGYLIPASKLPHLPEATPYERSIALILARFPLFATMPGATFTTWLQILPTGPGTHRLIAHLMAPEILLDQLTEKDFDEYLAFFASFNTEDVAVNGRVQKDMHSKYAKEGVLHEQELPLLIFQRYLAEMLEEPADA